MYVVKVANNSGKIKEWDRFFELESAQHERNLLICEHDFWPEDVFVEEVKLN